MKQLRIGIFLGLWCSLLGGGAAQMPATLQFFLPGGQLPPRALKVTLFYGDRGKITGTTDAKGGYALPDIAPRPRLLTLQVEGDRQNFSTTIVQLQAGKLGASAPIFLTPLDTATFSPGPDAQDINAYDASAPADAKAARDNAVRASAQNKPMQALEEFTRAITLYPRYLRAINEYGMLEFQRGQLDAAAAAFAHAASFRSRFAFPRLNLALTRIRQDRKGEASLLLRDLLADFPKFSPARAQYAELLFQSRQFDEAADEFKQLVADESLEPEKRADASMRLGILRQREERYSASVKDFQKALALGSKWPNEAQTHLFLGNSLQELNRLEEAEQEYVKAYAIAGKRGLLAQKFLGQIYATQKKYEQAIRAYELYFADLSDPQEAARIHLEIDRLKGEMKK